ncbi:MAG: BREX-2 system phosphatase PglZ [Polyangiaceae bacterium]|nr:BREX-2 system phosphatase PglZ [Polyangiaceae bacterium]
MTEAPLLTHDAIRQELAQIHRRGHRTMTTALFARGEPGDVALKLFSGEEQRFEVVPVRCELELRRALSRRGEKALALLVDYPAERLPADVQGRLAGGRVYRIDRGRLLAQRFGASSVSAELLGCRPLCEALLSEPAAFERVLGTTVDLHTAWRTLLARWARIERDGDLTEDRLLAIAATESPPRQAAALQPGTELGKALIEHLETVSGPIAPIAWRAWLAGRGVELAALTFLLDASLPALASDAGLRNALKIALRDVAPSLDPSAKSSLPLLQRWGGLAERLERRVPGPALDPILERAESFVPDPEMARRLADSRFLPCAFRATEEALAGALASFAKQPAAELVTQGKQELEQLGRHRLARSRDGLLSRARMALRLAAYLLTRPDLAEQASIHGSYGAVFTYAHHYVEEGSFVDHARDTARGPEETPLEQALGAVLERLDAQRDEDDTTFARACASWVAAGANDAGKVVPIAKGIDHFVVPFLKDAPHRKLLVVLLDGMSWANAVELLMDLEGHRYGLLRVADRTPRPMLAALPTLTGVSRSAFFAGKPIKTGEPQDTSKDPERFATHAGLRKIGIEGAELYLKDSGRGCFRGPQRQGHEAGPVQRAPGGCGGQRDRRRAERHAADPPPHHAELHPSARSPAGDRDRAEPRGLARRGPRARPHLPHDPRRSPGGWPPLPVPQRRGCDGSARGGPGSRRRLGRARKDPRRDAGPGARRLRPLGRDRRARWALALGGGDPRDPDRLRPAPPPGGARRGRDRRPRARDPALGAPLVVGPGAAQEAQGRQQSPAEVGAPHEGRPHAGRPLPGPARGPGGAGQALGRRGQRAAPTAQGPQDLRRPLRGRQEALPRGRRAARRAAPPRRRRAGRRGVRQPRGRPATERRRRRVGDGRMGQLRPIPDRRARPDLEAGPARYREARGVPEGAGAMRAAPWSI